MSRQEDQEGVRTVRKEMARHPIDTSLLNVSFHHGVVRLSGQVKVMRGHEMDLRAALENIAKTLRGKANIKDVVLECIYRT